jgi:hypothetical protein
MGPGNPFDFEPQPGDPFAAPSGPPLHYAPPFQPGPFPPGPTAGPHGPGAKGPNQDYNTLAVLSPILAVPVPPAGVVLGHLALPQIRRTGERGFTAAVCGLVLGYLLSVALVVAGIWWAVSGNSGSTSTTAGTTTSAPVTAPTPAPPSVATSVAPPSVAPRVKLDLARVRVGTCVEIQLRGSSENALDLYQVKCERRVGVYTVTARVAHSYECRSTYVAEPDDRAFALCLNPLQSG